MGVPAFYRWLINRYPNTVVNAIEEKPCEVVDSTSPNPNEIEFDNLYLDMNGIIHPCFHPDEHLFPPETFQQVFDNMFGYIDRIFSIVRPRKLLFLAIDGVAPRAKMNQQRSRRFQTSKNNELAEKEEERLIIEFENEGREVLPKTESETSDSNVITPGTEFIFKLSKELQRYIRRQINNDPGWKEIKVILSDANVPGEGEHKIMSFIRLQRTLPDYDPNTCHCLYGLDADLIMLSLATHEVHFSVLRENVFAQEQKPSFESARVISNQEAGKENGSSKSRGWFKQYPAKQEQDSALVDTVKRSSTIDKKPYQFLHVWILREYLELDMKSVIPPEKFDLERVIDDFIFICFFVGNDFLPHMPTLDIREGAVDLLMHVYKTEFNNLGDYLVDMEKVQDKHAGYIKLSRVEKFILKVGTYEARIFQKRSALQDRKVRRIQAEFERNREDEEDELVPAFDTNSYRNSRSYISDEDRTNQILQNTKELKEKLKDYVRKESDTFKDGFLGTDKVKLGSLGWHGRYYKQKFSAESPEDVEVTRKSIVEKYTEGLCWVLQYYFSGVASWTWFYPYHYGPFASDMKGLSRTRVKFEKGLPFKPFDQLLGVLPPRSAHALPLVYQPLMLDENSEIIEFFPNDFEVDLDGKRFTWQGVCKLSFIDENRLLAVTRKLEKELNDDEAMRNSKNGDRVFVGSSSNSKKLDDFMGIKLDHSNVADSEDLRDSVVLCICYDLPPQCGFIPRLLEGVNIPVKTISESDIVETQLWHEYQGIRHNNSNKYQQAARNANNNSKAMSPDATSPVFKRGTGFAGRGKPMINVASPSTSRVGFCTTGMRDLKISDTNRGFECHGRVPRQTENHVWARRNVQSDTRDNRYYSAATSAHGRGRGQHGNNGNDTGTSWHPRKYDVNHGRGRGQYGNNGNDTGTSWHPRKYDVNHGRGRGQYGNNGNDTGTSWHPRKYDVNHGDGSDNRRW